jgi:hypothetical protein
VSTSAVKAKISSDTKSLKVACGIGFVLHIDDQFTLMSLPSKFAKFEDEKFSIVFSDDTELNETTSEKKDEVMSFIIVKIPRDNLKEAIF